MNRSRQPKPKKLAQIKLLAQNEATSMNQAREYEPSEISENNHTNIV